MNFKRESGFSVIQIVVGIKGYYECSGLRLPTTERTGIYITLFQQRIVYGSTILNQLLNH